MAHYVRCEELDEAMGQDWEIEHGQASQREPGAAGTRHACVQSTSSCPFSSSLFSSSSISSSGFSCSSSVFGSQDHESAAGSQSPLWKPSPSLDSALSPRKPSFCLPPSCSSTSSSECLHSSSSGIGPPSSPALSLPASVCPSQPSPSLPSQQGSAVLSFPLCTPSALFFVQQQLPVPPHQDLEPRQHPDDNGVSPLTSHDGDASASSVRNLFNRSPPGTNTCSEATSSSRVHLAAASGHPLSSGNKDSRSRGEQELLDKCDPLLSNFQVLEEGFVHPLPFCPPSEFLWGRASAERPQNFGDYFPSVYHADPEMYRQLLQRHFGKQKQAESVRAEEAEGVPAELQEEYLDFTPAASFKSKVLSPLNFRARVRKVDEALRQLNVPPPPQLLPLRFEKFAQHARQRTGALALRHSWERTRTGAVPESRKEITQATRGESDEVESEQKASVQEASGPAENWARGNDGPRSRSARRPGSLEYVSSSSSVSVCFSSLAACDASSPASSPGSADRVSVSRCTPDSVDVSCSSYRAARSLASYFGFFLCAGVRVPCPAETVAWCVTRELYGWDSKLDPSVRSNLLDNLKHSRAKRFNRFACRIAWPPLAALCPYSELNIKAAYKRVIPLQTYQLVQNLYRSRFNRQTNLHNFAVDQHAIKQKAFATRESDQNTKRAGARKDTSASSQNQTKRSQGGTGQEEQCVQASNSSESESSSLRFNTNTGASATMSAPLRSFSCVAFPRVQASEIIVSVAVYHSTKGTKLASFDLLSSQSLLDLRDALLGCCESEFQPGVPLFPGSCFVIDGIIYPDARDPTSTSEYADVLVEHLRYSGKLATKTKITLPGNQPARKGVLQHGLASREQPYRGYGDNTLEQHEEPEKLQSSVDVCPQREGSGMLGRRQVLERRRELLQDKHTGETVEREVCIVVEPPLKRLDGTLRTGEVEGESGTAIQHGNASIGSLTSEALQDLTCGDTALSSSDAGEECEAEEEFVIIPQHEAVLNDMRVPLRSPACFLHQGSCEHRVFFWNFRQFDPKRDCTYSGAYPVRTYKPALKTIACRACEQSLASKGVANSVLCSVYNPTFLCDSCYSLLFGDQLQRRMWREEVRNDKSRGDRSNFDSESSGQRQSQDRGNSGIRWEALPADDCDPFAVHFDLFNG